MRSRPLPPPSKPPRSRPGTPDAAPAAGRDDQRIAKLLARAGIASRREIERMIAEGRVALNGAVIETPATVLRSLSGVTVDGQPVREPAPARLFRFHKPAGLLTTERDPKGRPTIYDRLPQGLPRLMPVGRLDLNTEGLLLLTTDGELKRRLELPSTGVTRTYRARAFGTISQEQLEDLIHGIEIDGVRYGSIDANLERRTGRNQWIEMRLTEGKNREVRRVLEHFGLQVSRLIRTAYGPFELANLPPGAVDEIRQHDIVQFTRTLGGKAAAIAPEAIPFDEAERPVRRAVPRPAPRPAPRDAARPAPRPRAARPAPAAARPSREERNSLHHRPPRQPDETARPSRGRRPAPAPALEAADELRKRPKRGAGWAKAKPSSRPTKRGGPPRKGPTRGRPGGGKR